MGNKPTRKSRIHQPYNQMVKDAISAMKERPGSTQADVLEYLEDKYGRTIPAKAKKNLETVLSSMIKTKATGRGRGGGPKSRRSTIRKVRFKAKPGTGPSRRRPGPPRRLQSKKRIYRRLNRVRRKPRY